MLTRNLGNSGLQLTTIGLGTWAIGGGDWKFGWGPQDEREAVLAIQRAIELGINWIDTAAVYGDGRSEELVGEALKQMSGPPPLLATKFGRVIQPDGSIIPMLKRESVMAECAASLRRLGVDTIDLYQMHWPQPEEDIEEAWSAMCELQRQGKVRYIGVSNHNVTQMARLQSIHPIASLQPPYSMLAREIEQEILPYCAEQGIGVVCYSPMCKGLLSGRFDRARARSLPENDHRIRDPRFREPALSQNLDFVERLRPLAAAVDLSVGELAIAWTLRRPEVTSAIVGARSPRQIEEMIRAAERTIPTEIWEEVA